MSILANAIQAIECGVKDFNEGTDPRLKSSIRNMHAGILLLLKEKLLRLSGKDNEQALIKKNVSPHLIKGKIVWKGKGKKTVDIQEIKDRFETLGINFDWKMFDQITNIRNEVEHYFTRANKKVIGEAVSKSFVLMRNFMIRELKIDPKRKITNDSWDILLSVSDVYEIEKKSCSLSHKFFNSHSATLNLHAGELTCTDCESDLIKFKKGGSADCRSCGKKFDKEETILTLTEIVFGADDYISVKDGGEPSITTCPTCDAETLIGSELQCATCGESYSGECSRCSSSIPIYELGGSMCSYCEYITSKDD